MNRHTASLSIAAIALVLPLGATESKIEFRNPSEQNTLKINVGRNNLKLRGGSGNEVKVVSTQAGEKPEPVRKDGLRVLGSKSTGISLVLESPNLAILDAGIRPGVEPPQGDGDLEVTVPRKTSVIVRGTLNGDVRISDLEGDVEVTSLTGDVVLEKLKGAAVVETTRGDIEASFAEVSGKKPLSFTSTMGDVVVRIPRDAKADVRMRSQSGDMLTDFSDSEFKVTSETMSPSRSVTLRSESGRSATASTSASSSSSSSSPRSIADDLKRQAEVMAREAEAIAREVERTAQTERMNAEMTAELARQQAARIKEIKGIPGVKDGFSFSYSGGHSIAGQLNGGGTEISITTLRGDITLRKL